MELNSELLLSLLLSDIEPTIREKVSIIYHTSQCLFTRFEWPAQKWFACYCLCWSTTGLFSLCRVHKSNHYSPCIVTENEAYFLPLRWIIVISLQLIKSFVSRLHHIAARRILLLMLPQKIYLFYRLGFRSLVSIQFFTSKWLFRQCNEACSQLTIAFLSLQLTFTVKSVQQDVLCITVFDRDLFSPNGKF